ncbi:MAG: ribosome biogenesis factor YjgA [Moraxellaceae bacterium]|nr:ribosome biogenesis factor YjgA [Moraxellaceae bacterium]MDZ4388023.1 ribosome biogenesis factor YjgA [Moraxellaceae bacterium]
MSSTPEYEFDDEFGPSKSDQKRSVERLQDLGERLAKLREEKLRKLPIDDALLQALLTMRQLKSHEAIRRHRQYIGKLMRHANEPALLAALDPFKQPALVRQLALLHQKLMEQGDAAASDVLQRYPAADRHTLRQHIRLARKEAELSIEKPETPQTARDRLMLYLQELAALAN